MLQVAPRVLVVEDDPEAAMLARRLLVRELQGVEVEVVDRLARARDVLARAAPAIDAVVLDLGLPDVDRGDPLGALTSLLSMPDVPPVVVVTSRDDELAQAAVAVGAQDFITKDQLVRPRALARAVAFALQRHRASHALSQQRARLLAANAQLRHFATSLVHDLKGPLATAAMSLETARVPAMAERPRDRDDMLDRAQRILRRINEQVDLLLSEVLAVAVGPREVVDVAAMVADVLDLLPDRDRLAVEVDAADAVLGRPGALRQVVHNLLDNALTHNPDGPVRVRVSTHVSEPFVCLVIEDDGVGIPERIRDKVLVAGSAGEHSNGHGLGLATVALTAHTMGATMRIDDAPLGGARISIAMPGPDLVADDDLGQMVAGGVPNPLL